MSAPDNRPALDPAASAAGHRTATVWRLQTEPAGLFEDTDELACEIPVALEYNGLAHATVLATPTHLEDFALGFSLTEGLIRSAADLYDLEVTEKPDGIVLEVTIASACLDQLKRRRRALAGRTGCGLCGLESLSEVERELAPLTARPTPLNASVINHAMAQLRQAQPIHNLTGATHAAGWADANGTLLAVREDVGRHNALDKLIGHMAREGLSTNTGLAVISSRASFEMVQKAAAAGINALAAVSAPTQYAVSRAAELNVLLAGFTRNNRFTVYAHPEYLSKDFSL
jgi:FdhD protein